MAGQPTPVSARTAGPRPASLPSVLVADADPAAALQCSALLDQLGYRHCHAATPREALDRIGRDTGIGIVLACVEAASADGLALVEEVHARSPDSRPLATIIAADEVTADLAVKALRLDAADLLARPFGLDACSAALRRALRRIGVPPPAGADGVGAQLARLTAAIEGMGIVVPPGPEDAGHSAAATTLHAIIAARRLRDRHFPGELFADPAWDILLDLARAEAGRQQVSVSSVCIAAAVPMSTALRWVRLLTEAGLVRRWTDPRDRRRDLVALAEPAAAAMRDYLSAVQAVVPLK
jgi:CheY-like chemotaxis protein